MTSVSRPTQPPKSGIRVEITCAIGTVFRSEVLDVIVKLDHCVLELSSHRPSRFAFFREGTIESRTAEVSRTFHVAEGCLSVCDGQLTLVCQSAIPCRCLPCDCGTSSLIRSL